MPAHLVHRKHSFTRSPPPYGNSLITLLRPSSFARRDATFLWKKTGQEVLLRCEGKASVAKLALQMFVVKKCHRIEPKLLRVACHLSFDSKMRDKGAQEVINR